jgi:hypothetical protein
VGSIPAPRSNTDERAARFGEGGNGKRPRRRTKDNMKLKLVRDIAGADCTLGTLSVDGRFQCFTCEDVERLDGPKIHGKTAIPRGRYNVAITHSNRFKRSLPLLIDVPGFSGIRIHPGNTAADTEGCILPGTRRTLAGVIESRVAFEALFAKIGDAISKGGSVTIEIVGPETNVPV